MVYDFDEIVVRRATNSYKWDTTEEDVLPMWVADMDFRTSPAIIEALHKRVEHGIFGYTKVPDKYYDAVVDWFGRRHGWDIVREWVIYTTGVVPALSAIVRAVCSQGDKVLIQTPVYNCFFSSIRNQGCEVVTNPLINMGGNYLMDFDDLERKAADPQVKLMLLCNPHNPVGRVWTRDELVRLGEICLRHNVVVVADEIHCELVYPGHRYTPFASLSEEFSQNSATCLSPSKAFNLAGLQIANVVVADPQLRAKIDKVINIHEVCDLNSFGIEALMAAYNHSFEWLEELKKYLFENLNYLKTYFEQQLPQLSLTTPEGSYLVWVDCRELGLSSKQIGDLLLTNGRLLVNQGAIYGSDGEGFIRINIACRRELLIDGLRRLSNSLIQK